MESVESLDSLDSLDSLTCPEIGLQSSKSKTGLRMKKVNIRQDYEILQILREYCSTDIGVNELMRKYSLGSSTQLIRWFRKFADPNITKSSEMKGKDIDTYKQKAETLAQENARLRRALERAELRAEALDIMIDIAEKELKIPIRKKPGVKR